jgi:hypothetical protein
MFFNPKSTSSTPCSGYQPYQRRAAAINFINPINAAQRLSTLSTSSTLCSGYQPYQRRAAAINFINPINAAQRLSTLSTS